MYKKHTKYFEEYLINTHNLIDISDIQDAIINDKMDGVIKLLLIRLNSMVNYPFYKNNKQTYDFKTTEDSEDILSLVMYHTARALLYYKDHIEELQSCQSVVEFKKMAFIRIKNTSADEIDNHLKKQEPMGGVLQKAQMLKVRKKITTLINDFSDVIKHTTSFHSLEQIATQQIKKNFKHKNNNESKQILEILIKYGLETLHDLQTVTIDNWRKEYHNKLKASAYTELTKTLAEQDEYNLYILFEGDNTEWHRLEEKEEIIEVAEKYQQWLETLNIENQKIFILSFGYITKEGEYVSIKLSQEDIANKVGLSRPTISKRQKALRDRFKLFWCNK